MCMTMLTSTDMAAITITTILTSTTTLMRMTTLMTTIMITLTAMKLPTWHTAIPMRATTTAGPRGAMRYSFSPSSFSCSRCPGPIPPTPRTMTVFLTWASWRSSARPRAPKVRDHWNGQAGRLKGKFDRSAVLNDKMFRLVVMKMTCCAPDATPIDIVIESDTQVPYKDLQGQWVKVTGTITFRNDLPGYPPGQYVTVLKLTQPLLKIPPDPKQYVS